MPLKSWTIRISIIYGCCAATAGALGAQTTSSATPEQVVQTQVTAFNHHDVARMLSVESDTASICVLGDTTDTLTIHTADTARMVWTDWFSKDPKINAQVTQRFVAGEFVANYLHLTGQTNGPPRDLIVIWHVRDGCVVHVWQTPPLMFEPGRSQPSKEPLRASLQRVTNALDRHDWDVAAAVFADTIIYRGLGEPTVKRMSRTEMRAGFVQFGQRTPRIAHQVLDEMILPPFVVQHERFTGYRDGSVTDAVDVFQVNNGRIIAEWESDW